MKEYTKPNMNMIKIVAMQHLLDASKGGVTTGGTVGNAYNENDETSSPAAPSPSGTPTRNNPLRPQLQTPDAEVGREPVGADPHPYPFHGQDV